MLAERAFCEGTKKYLMLISNDFSFKDVDECQLSPNICEQKCINVQGSYYVRLIKGDER
jgi:hypothetical protein